MAEAQYAPNHTVDPETGMIESNAYIKAFDAQRKKAFLEVYRNEGLGLWRTCRLLGLSCDTVHKHREIDPVFRAAFDEAKMEYGDDLEAISRINAKNPKSVIERIFQLKALFPEKYGDAKASRSLNISISLDPQLVSNVSKRQQAIEVDEIPAEKLENLKSTADLSGSTNAEI